MNKILAIIIVIAMATVGPVCLGVLSSFRIPPLLVPPQAGLRAVGAIEMTVTPRHKTTSRQSPAYRYFSFASILYAKSISERSGLRPMASNKFIRDKLIFTSVNDMFDMYVKRETEKLTRQLRLKKQAFNTFEEALSFLQSKKQKKDTISMCYFKDGFNIDHLHVLKTLDCEVFLLRLRNQKGCILVKGDNVSLPSFSSIFENFTSASPMVMIDLCFHNHPHARKAPPSSGDILQIMYNGHGEIVAYFIIAESGLTQVKTMAIASKEPREIYSRLGREVLYEEFKRSLTEKNYKQLKEILAKKDMGVNKHPMLQKIYTQILTKMGIQVQHKTWDELTKQDFEAGVKLEDLLSSRVSTIREIGVNLLLDIDPQGQNFPKIFKNFCTDPDGIIQYLIVQHFGTPGISQECVNVDILEHFMRNSQFNRITADSVLAISIVDLARMSIELIREKYPHLIKRRIRSLENPGLQQKAAIAIQESA